MTSDDPVPSASRTINGIKGHLTGMELPDGTPEDWSRSGLPTVVPEENVMHLRVGGIELDMKTGHAETRWRREDAQVQLDPLNLSVTQLSGEHVLTRINALNWFLEADQV